MTQASKVYFSLEKDIKEAGRSRTSWSFGRNKNMKNGRARKKRKNLDESENSSFPVAKKRRRWMKLNFMDVDLVDPVKIRNLLRSKSFPPPPNRLMTRRSERFRKIFVSMKLIRLWHHFTFISILMAKWVCLPIDSLFTLSSERKMPLSSHLIFQFCYSEKIKWKWARQELREFEFCPGKSP